MVSRSRPCSLENGNAREEKKENPRQSAKEGMRETEAEKERACGCLSSLCLPERVEGKEPVGCTAQDAPRPCSSNGGTSVHLSLQPRSGKALSLEPG